MRVPDPDALVHLQFRRFAGCPVCNLHLRSFAVRNADVLAAGVREAVVFHAPAAELRPHVEDLPFPVVADPGKKLYAEFGVESAKRALLDPRAWPAIAAGVLRSVWDIVVHRRPAPSLNPSGGRFGLPADFLIGPDGNCDVSVDIRNSMGNQSTTIRTQPAKNGARPATLAARPANRSNAGSLPERWLGRGGRWMSLMPGSATPRPHGRSRTPLPVGPATRCWPAVSDRPVHFRAEVDGPSALPLCPAGPP